MKMSPHLCKGDQLLRLSLGVSLVAFLSIIYKPCLAGSYLSNVPQCEKITSDTGKNGTITSPHFPHPYPARTHCRFDFIGKPNERVQIVFTDFNLYHPDHKELKECGGADMLSAFVYNKPNDQLNRVEDFCGVETPMAVMSSDNRLTLEMNAPHSSRLNRGFHALYSFITDFGVRGGRHQADPEYPCTFIFNVNETSNGTFTSPNYPGYYPRDTECRYLFYGNDNEHVELYFTYFDISGIQPCDELTHSDYVEFSNYQNVDRKYDIQCGTLKELKVKSDRNFFRVTFKSNDRFDATGFQATYQFTDKNNHLPIRNVRSFGSSNTRFGPTDWLRGLLLIFALITYFK